MAKQKPKRAVFNQVLKLVTQLTCEEQEELVQEINLAALRREIKIGIDAADKGEVHPAEQVFAELKQRIAERKKSEN